MGGNKGMVEVLALFVLLVLAASSMAAAAATHLGPPPLYVLGDSTLDVGNNNYLPGADVRRANRRYYGIDFPGFPAGRFSNGQNTADFVGIIQLATTALTTGVSYASADAGILDSTNAGRCIPLSRQVQYFNATRAAMVATVGSGKATRMLSRSVFLVGVGSNDLFVFGFAERARNRSAAEQQSDGAELLANLISNYSATITELHSMGARKFAVINVGPVGCVPIFRRLDAAGQCDAGLNQLAAAFDDALRSLLAGLAERLPGLVYTIGDYFALAQDALAKPLLFGFTDIAAACCGSGRLLADADCMPNSTLCANRGQHVFWDLYHPSKQACFLTALAFYVGPDKYTTPINFQQLALSS
ncbi:hypothetical protein BS78_K326900 [Paspalum vaginatum]|uniref:GDSL esterase/lipase n=1 Tax=Paspalum vaginatum TaxID=158149 RepID=A0A9W8CE33_9POAL|nr:hypothetical protein BS78_K326900 [Paspalum vaginatum]